MKSWKQSVKDSVDATVWKQNSVINYDLTYWYGL